MPRTKPTAIVLGGTTPHISLIENLKDRGFYVVLVDFLDAPPAREVADEHICESSLNVEGVLALAMKTKASLVIAAAVDRANVVAAFVSEQLGLPAPYSYATAEQIANKASMRTRLAEIGVAQPHFQLLSDSSQTEQLSVEYPVVVKPIDCGGSKGVRQVANQYELRQAALEAFNVTRADQILVEQFCEGVEISVDCFVQNGEPHILLLRKKHIHHGGLETVLTNYASVSPASISPGARDRIYGLARSIVRGFGLRTTPLLMQFIVDGDKAHVIEFAPRVGGGLNHRLVLLSNGVDIIDATVNAYLGQACSFAPDEQSDLISANHVYADAGSFGYIGAQIPLIEEGIVEEFYVHKACGAKIGLSLASADRIASFIVRAKNAEELLRKTREAFERLIVLDVQGRSIIRRDLCLRAL